MSRIPLALRFSARAPLLGALLLPLLSACDQSSPSDGSAPLRVLQTIGSTGNLPGQFQYPRALASDAATNSLFTIDKFTGRVQRFEADSGRLMNWWTMPKSDLGKPTGISIHPSDGVVYVADTHEHRIALFTPDGQLISTFGSMGTEPGQMIYPTDVAFGPEGRIYVSEFGGNDRIQVFDPAGNTLFSFGTFGPETGQFNRPQSIEFNADLNELWIADACNHRIVITDPHGRWIAAIGTPGTGPGQLSYPYAIVLQPDGSVLVSEFGNNRVQHLARDGTPLGLYGRMGTKPGEMRCPWGMAALGDRVYLVQSGNDRIEAFSRPR